MKNQIYDVLSKIQRWLPALGTAYLGLSAVWGLPYGDQINQTVVIIATLLATTLEIANANYHKQSTTAIKMLDSETLVELISKVSEEEKK